MIVLTFQPEFHELVRDGRKDRTLRAPRKRPVKVGQEVSLRRWTGRPYCSPQAELRRSVIVEVCPIELEMIGGAFAIDLCGVPIWQPAAVESFAVADGFRSAADMRDWFVRVHGLPARLTMIRWGDPKREDV